MELTLKLAHVVSIAIAIATRTEDDRQGTVTPKVLAHTIDTRHQHHHVGLALVLSNCCLRLLVDWRRLLGDRRPWHSKNTTRNVAVEYLTVRTGRKVVYNIFLTIFFHLFFFLFSSFCFLINLPFTLSLNTCELLPDSKWL